MFAVHHPAVLNLWFNFDQCVWTLDRSQRTVFASEREARVWASLPADGGVVVRIN